MREPGDGFALIYTSPPEYEKLCLEIYYDEHYVGEITQEDGKERARITLCAPPHSKDSWDFSLKEFLDCLNDAFKELD